MATGALMAAGAVRHLAARALMAARPASPACATRRTVPSAAARPMPSPPCPDGCPFPPPSPVSATQPRFRHPAKGRVRGAASGCADRPIGPGSREIAARIQAGDHLALPPLWDAAVRQRRGRASTIWQARVRARATRTGSGGERCTDETRGSLLAVDAGTSRSPAGGLARSRPHAARRPAHGSWRAWRTLLARLLTIVALPRLAVTTHRAHADGSGRIRQRADGLCAIMAQLAVAGRSRR